MMRLFTRRGGRRDGDAPPAAPRRGGDSIELLTTQGHMSGWVATDGRRLTDVLNDSDHLTVSVSPDSGESPVSVPTESILLVVPPERPSERQRQVHRRLRRVAIRVGHLDLEGHVHVTPGVPVEAFLARLVQRFIPFTDVVVADGVPDAAGRHLPVAIVNVRAIVAVETLS